MGMAANADAVPRRVRSLPLPANETPRAVGVDDWALKKGLTYGTILGDLESRRVADLLPDRTAPTLAAWLQARGSVEVKSPGPLQRIRTRRLVRGPRGGSGRRPLAPVGQLAPDARPLAGPHSRAAGAFAAGRRPRAAASAHRGLPAHAGRRGGYGAQPCPAPGPL